MPADKVVVRLRLYNWVRLAISFRRFDPILRPTSPVPHAGVSAAMDKKGRTSMVNNRLRQESGAVPRRIVIDSAAHMSPDSGKVLPNQGKRPNVAHLP
ncbi:hypothetical protein NKI96_18610 [Mesorhizobium sp. M0292]|uniref:hypothetical protein n=1 Tax=Mesorhizobium sp. M0292 TaxID=2956929 RepID=UPI003335CA3D